MSINHVNNEGLTIKNISFKATFGEWLYDISENTTYNLSSAIGLTTDDKRLNISLWNRISGKYTNELNNNIWLSLYSSIAATLTIYYNISDETKYNVYNKVDSNRAFCIDFHLPIYQTMINTDNGHICIYPDGKIYYWTPKYGVSEIENYLANNEINMVLSWL